MNLNPSNCVALFSPILYHQKNTKAMHQLHQIPIFEALADSQNIIIAGAGGGFDIFSGIPLIINLIKQGKQVIIGNFSFTWLEKTTATKVFPYCYEIHAGDYDLSKRQYFPEKYLKEWLVQEGITVPIYAFNRTGINPLKDAYKYLIKKHHIDTILLVDGGTDSLMFGDEEGLGTPQEDICSMSAVYRSGVKKQFLLSIGFGIDHFHGVSHYRFLENVATLSKDGGYLGLFQVLNSMDEGQKYAAAVEYVNEKMKSTQSIVANSIASALEGQYGDYHATARTVGSELWINPLMTIYWSFDLRKVMKRVTYYALIKNTNTLSELNGILSKYRWELKEIREKRQIPI